MSFQKVLEAYEREMRAKQPDSNIELELRFKIRSVDEHKSLIVNMLKEEQTLSAVSYGVAIIKLGTDQHSKPKMLAGLSSGAQRADFPADKIAMRVYHEKAGKIIKDESLAFSEKKRIDMARITNEFIEYRLVVSSESPSEQFDIKLFNILRLKLRLSLQLKRFPNWRFDFTLSDELTNMTDFVKRRDALFVPGMTAANFAERAPFDIARNLEFEIEHVGSGRAIDIAEIYNVIDFVRDIGGFSHTQTARYQEVIYEIAKLIYPASKAANFRAKQGLKALLPQVAGLTREMYFKEVLPHIVGMRATIKLDGQGVAGLIQRDVEKKEAICEVVGSDLVVFPVKDATAQPTVFAAELWNGMIYVFDVFVFDGQDLINTADLGVREKYISRVVAMLAPKTSDTMSSAVAHAKQHIILTENYARELAEIYEKKYEFPTDGIIFDNHLKWKPIEKLTIDFLTMDASTVRPKEQKQHTYWLFAGMNKSQQAQYNIRPMQEYNRLFAGRSFHDYYPVQFAPPDRPQAYVFNAPIAKGDEIPLPNLHNRICEYRWDVTRNIWIFERIRDDRDVEVARGSYFGNNIAIALATWNSTHNPLTFDMLRSTIADAPIDKSYFGATDRKYAPANKFSSFVKEQSVKKFSNLSWVVDLACGRGADLQRWSRTKIANALCIDNDAEALKELLTRHDGLRRKTNFYKVTVYTHQANLNDPYQELLSHIQAQYPIPKSGAPLIVCNMALHYMCENDATIWNFIMLVDKLLAIGGHFVFTCYNGARIFDLLAGKPQIDFYEENTLKYSIKRDYKEAEFRNYGQQIQPLLGCAGGVYVAEYLVSISYWVAMFKRRGFKLVEQARFDSLLEEYSIDNIENYDALGDADYDHLALYDYVILQKEKEVKDVAVEAQPSEVSNVVALPGRVAGVPVYTHDLEVATSILDAEPIERLPTKQVKAKLTIAHAMDVHDARVHVIVQLAKKVMKLAVGDRVEINVSASGVEGGTPSENGFEVVIEEIARVTQWDHLFEKYALPQLSASVQSRDEFIRAFEKENGIKRAGFVPKDGLVALRVRKL